MVISSIASFMVLPREIFCPLIWDDGKLMPSAKLLQVHRPFETLIHSQRARALAPLAHSRLWRTACALLRVHHSA